MVLRLGRLCADWADNDIPGQCGISFQYRDEHLILLYFLTPIVWLLRPGGRWPFIRIGRNPFLLGSQLIVHLIQRCDQTLEDPQGCRRMEEGAFLRVANGGRALFAGCVASVFFLRCFLKSRFCRSVAVVFCCRCFWRLKVGASPLLRRSVAPVAWSRIRWAF